MTTNTQKKFAVLVLSDSLGIRHVNQFLMAYDLEANGGHGDFAFTSNLSDAMMWDSPGDILRAMAATPKCHPIRLDDGQPNRPLRIWTVQLVEVPATLVHQQSSLKGH